MMDLLTQMRIIHADSLDAWYAFGTVVASVIFGIPLVIVCVKYMNVLFQKIRRGGRIGVGGAIVAIIGLIAFAGTKVQHVWQFKFANGLMDSGSVCEGDEIRAVWRVTSSILLDGYNIRAQYRDGTIRNDEGEFTDEWKDLEGCLVGQLSKTWIVENATNMHVAIWAEYVEKPTVHTNGVYKLSGVMRSINGEAKFVTPGIRVYFVKDDGLLKCLTPTNEPPANLLKDLAEEANINLE